MLLISPTAAGKEAFIPKTVVNKFLKGIFDREILEGQIDPALWERTWKQIFSSFESGYGRSLAKISYNTPDFEYLQQVKFNTAVFSAFKQNQQIKDAADLLLKPDGTARSWREFRDLAMEIDDTYNKRWLQTEYNQAHDSALQARRWRDAEKTSNLYPNLIYVAVQDNRTREFHRKLHGTIRPMNDPFWRTYYPPIDWGCRCSARPTDQDPTDLPKDLPEVPAGMDVNPGQEAKIFSDNHPYIKGSADRKAELLKFVKTQINQ